MESHTYKCVPLSVSFGIFLLCHIFSIGIENVDKSTLTFNCREKMKWFVRLFHNQFIFSLPKIHILGWKRDRNKRERMSEGIERKNGEKWVSALLFRLMQNISSWIKSKSKVMTFGKYKNYFCPFIFTSVIVTKRKKWIISLLSHSHSVTY